MSVQAAVALLNKNASSTTSSTATTATTATNKSSVASSSWKANNVTTTVTPSVDNDKKAELKQIRTRTQSGGLASILSKFDQQLPVTSSPSTATNHTATTATTSSSPSDNNNNNTNTTNSVVSNNNKKTSTNNNFAALAKTSSQSPNINNMVTLTTEEPTTFTSTSTLRAKSAIITTPSSSTSAAIKKHTKAGRHKSVTASAQAAAITQRSRSASVRDRAATINRTVVADTIGHELVAIYQDTLNKLQAAEEEIEKLNQEHQNTVATMSSNNNNVNNNNNVSEDNKTSSQLRDYEIRIQYLSEKLDQLSQEHNLLERQLDQERKQRRTNSKRCTLDTPISPEFRPFSKLFDMTNTTATTTTTNSTTTGDELDRRRITVDTNLTSEHEDFWNCLLDGYEEKGTISSSMNTSMTTDDENNNSSNVNKTIISVLPPSTIPTTTDESNNDKEQQQQQLVLAELLFVKKQLTAVEKGAQIMLERNLRDLEKERQQTRALTEVVHKQDQLIASLEIKVCPKEEENENDDDSNNSSNNQHLLLQEQVELQRIELEDKRGLLTRLLDEREELLRQVMSHNSNKPLPTSGMRSRSASVRSSIDVLSEMSKDNPITAASTRYPLSRASSSSLQQISPRSSLGSHAAALAKGRSTPPLTAPPKNPLPPLPPRSSTSMHSILSPASSWSSADYAAATGRYSGNNQQPSQPQQHYFHNSHHHYQQQRELVGSTVYKESSQPSNTMTMESPHPPHPSAFLHHYSSQQEQPVWLDYQSNEQKQQQQQQQQSPQPQPQTSSTISRSQTIKLRKSNSNSNSAFWKGWKHRLGSR